MEQYIPKPALVAEIESLKSAAETMLTGKTDLPYWKAQKHLCERFLSFINTLQVKEVDLEKEAKECWDYIFALGWDENSLMTMNHKEFMTFAKHFFELGLQSTLSEEDMKLIWTIGDELPYMSEEEFYKELLKRYKAQKGEEYDRQSTENQRRG